MTKISLIAAMGKNRVIGMNNKLPWHLPADLKHFKALTIDKPVLMGRKTYESIGQALPKRTNIVLSSDPDFTVSDGQVCRSLAEVLEQTAASAELMVIGGAVIFEQCLPLAQTLYLTIIEHDFQGDVYFPAWEPTEWQEVERQDYKPDEKNSYYYSFIKLCR